MAVKQAAPRNRRISHPMRSPFTFYRGAARIMAPITLTCYAPAPRMDAGPVPRRREQDYEEVAEAVRSGRLEAVEGV